MGKIKLNNIRIFANHGCLDEEDKIGSAYRVDVIIKADLHKAAITDDLTNTVNYVYVNKIVKQEMAIRSQLLEHVANRIIDRLLDELELIKKVTVSIAKINPPIGGNVADVRIIMTRKQKIKK